MANKRAIVEFKKCNPRVCAPTTGICPAVKTCKHKLLVQESPHDAPMLISERMCVGCGDCAKPCPCGAIVIRSGV
jgi:ATP-binding cassette subfamily E protein 1